jgi:lipoprotein-anchoring transpeptidase ErfK/SrfK
MKKLFGPKRIFVQISFAILIAVAPSSCKRANELSKGQDVKPKPLPVIEVSPLAQGNGQWKIAGSEIITITIIAPGGERARILSRLEGADEDREALKIYDAPFDSSNGRLITQLNLAPDFTGDLWAEVSYPDGTSKHTETIALTTTLKAAGVITPMIAGGGSVGTDESARSDKLTGGRIRRTRLIAGEPDIRITINVPAFLLTLWQNGKEVRKYNVGIGRKDFPIPIGEREASAIIFNPYWIPPDSTWVRSTSGVEPYERIKPGDPRNPLGKVKIQLGEGYLIHEAENEEDIGRAVSHGCVRIMGEDLFDLAEMIVHARNLAITEEALDQAKDSVERVAVPLDSPLLVDVNYDQFVVEGRVLHLYPDVYERGVLELDSLRAELQSAGVDISKLDDQTLQQLLDRVEGGQQFVIGLAAIRRGHWNAGRVMPVTESPASRNSP